VNGIVSGRRFTGGPNDDVDLAAEGGEEAHQPLDREVAEMPPQHAGHVGLADAHELGGMRLGQGAGADPVMDAAHELGLEQVGVGVGVAEVGEQVGRAVAHGVIGIGAHRPSPSPFVNRL
jgi:hypothetical protein